MRPAVGALECFLQWVVVQKAEGVTEQPHEQGLTSTLVPNSAQLELVLSPTQPNLSQECVPKVLKLSSNVNEVSLRCSS